MHNNEKSLDIGCALKYLPIIMFEYVCRDGGNIVNIIVLIYKCYFVFQYRMSTFIKIYIHILVL
jgi:hypothetical protein